MRIVTAVALTCVLLGGHAFAMGHGRGTTKIDFQLDSSEPTNSRLFAKIDISAALSQLGNTGTPSSNDDLEGWKLMVTIGGSETFSAICDSKGKTKEDSGATPPVPFTAKLTANGKILQIMANDLNLQTLFGIDPTKGAGTVAVEIDVTATKTDSNNVTTTVTLSKQSVTFNYSVKGNKVKGSNH